jgi:anti-sigma factor RsiW
MQCAESLRLQAYFDGELDADSAHAIEGHLEHCGACRGLLKELEQLRFELRGGLEVERAPVELRARILEALDGELVPVRRAAPAAARKRRFFTPFWAGAFSGIGGSAVAAATLAFVLAVPSAGNALVDDVVSAHVRSLMPDHLIEVVSTDRHTVKPWFAGHADVSPAVADFEPQGYRLVGGRADYLERQRAAAVVYQHGKHTINVFSWASDATIARNQTRNGYHLAFWKVGNLQYCAISDTGWDELGGLVTLLRDLATRDQHPADARE